MIARFGHGRFRLFRAVKDAVAAIGEPAAEWIQMSESRHDGPAAGAEAALRGRNQIEFAEFGAQAIVRHRFKGVKRLEIL